MGLRPEGQVRRTVHGEGRGRSTRAGLVQNNLQRVIHIAIEADAYLSKPMHIYRYRCRNGVSFDLQRVLHIATEASAGFVAAVCRRCGLKW